MQESHGQLVVHGDDFGRFAQLIHYLDELELKYWKKALYRVI
ncbi:hypothetical protein PPHE_a2761 [Pseudoalteromonas phenolica O-BC30]|nr:hypothetical protein [Pseudoalteromonas phenolica O-BC30]